jgi:glycine/D-amino acid oxidase-like deaminating enzyme
MVRPTFPDYPDRCGWNAMLPPRMSNPAAEGEIRADYAVVGAGFTGLAAARRLAELAPQARIVVLEATEVGEGSSGRNSGFASPTDIPGSASAQAVAAQQVLDRFGTEGFGWLVDLIEGHGIECGVHVSGRIKGAATERGEAVVREMHATVRALGVPHELLGPDEMERRIGSRYYRLGLFTEAGYLLDPAALVRGLAGSLPPNVSLHERTPVLALRRDGAWRLDTPDASIIAGQVVMAVNAAAKFFGHLRDRVVTIYTYAGITAAMAPGDAAGLGGMASWGLLPSHRLGTTVRRVGPDRLMVRSMYAYERGLPGDEVRRTLLSCFHRRYPALAHVGLDYVWGGTTALTLNGAPWWGRLDEGLHGFAGCNGSGIVKGTVLGKRLAETILGQDSSAEIRAAYGTPSQVAPEPFRSIGFRVISAIERRRAGAET